MRGVAHSDDVDIILFFPSRMPYKLRKAPSRDLYWVVTIATGEKHSKDPLPLEKARAQLRALMSAETTAEYDGSEVEDYNGKGLYGGMDQPGNVTLVGTPLNDPNANDTHFASVYKNIIQELGKGHNASIDKLYDFYDNATPEEQHILDSRSLLVGIHQEEQEPERDYLSLIEHLTYPLAQDLISMLGPLVTHQGGSLHGGMEATMVTSAPLPPPDDPEDDKPHRGAHEKDISLSLKDMAMAMKRLITHRDRTRINLKDAIKEHLKKFRPKDRHATKWIEGQYDVKHIRSSLSKIDRQIRDLEYRMAPPVPVVMPRVTRGRARAIIQPLPGVPMFRPPSPAPSASSDASDDDSHFDGFGHLRKSLEGAGLWDFVKDALNPRKVYNEIFNPESIARKRITDVSRGIRTDYPPSARATLERYGNWKVVEIRLRRDPVQSAIHTAFNLITLGRWNRGREEEKMDTLFHLGIEIGLENGGQEHRLLVEKNEVINVGSIKPMMSDTQTCRVPTPSPPVTLLEFLKRGEDRRPGGEFFRYDPFANNCQDFVAILLVGNNIYTSQARAFVKQNVDSLLSKLPSYTHSVARGITDLGAIANVAVEGAGTATPGNPFRSQLEKAGIEPSAYLKEATRRAKEHRYPYKLLGFAKDGEHKLAIPDKNGRMVAFGKVGYGDHIIYSFLEKKHSVPEGTAEKKRNVFQKSHSKMKGAWASDPFSANNLALKVLW